MRITRLATRSWRRCFPMPIPCTRSRSFRAAARSASRCSCRRRIATRIRKPFIETQIAILMGGRIAEELFLRQMTSGASNDIERATELARKMVCELGMSPLGPLHYRRPSSAFDTDARAAGFSEETARRVDEEIRTLVMRGYETARQIIERQRAAVKALAEELLEVESVDADRLRASPRGVGRAVDDVSAGSPRRAERSTSAGRKTNPKSQIPSSKSRQLGFGFGIWGLGFSATF